MSGDKDRATGQEPRLGGGRSLRLSGMEPALSNAFESPYGRYRVPGYEAPRVTGRRRPLVVLAEFESNTAELVSLLAESNGYDVRRTSQGGEALRLVRSLEPNLLVTSLRLPGMTGLDLTRAVRAAKDAMIARTPVLIMDVRQGARIFAAAFASGADDYLELPYEVPVFLKAWRRVTGFLQRPAPLTALTNDDPAIRTVAVDYLLRARPEGLAAGLGELLWQPNPQIRDTVRGALRQLGTAEAQAVLAREGQPRRGLPHE